MAAPKDLAVAALLSWTESESHLTAGPREAVQQWLNDPKNKELVRRIVEHIPHDPRVGARETSHQQPRSARLPQRQAIRESKSPSRPRRGILKPPGLGGDTTARPPKRLDNRLTWRDLERLGLSKAVSEYEQMVSKLGPAIAKRRPAKPSATLAMPSIVERLLLPEPPELAIIAKYVSYGLSSLADPLFHVSAVLIPLAIYNLVASTVGSALVKAGPLGTLRHSTSPAVAAALLLGLLACVQWACAHRGARRRQAAETVALGLSDDSIARWQAAYCGQLADEPSMDGLSRKPADGGPLTAMSSAPSHLPTSQPRQSQWQEAASSPYSQPADDGSADTQALRRLNQEIQCLQMQIQGNIPSSQDDTLKHVGHKADMAKVTKSLQALCATIGMECAEVLTLPEMVAKLQMARAVVGVP